MAPLPFDGAQFLAVFSRYNLAVWPAQFALLVLGAVIGTVPNAAGPRIWRIALSGLAALWVWMALAYHLAFFLEINGMAAVFGALFLVQAGLLAREALAPHAAAHHPFRERVGVVLIIYALFGYPLASILAGQSWPEIPTFGVPCPTTILTIGVLMRMRGRVPGRLAVIPVLWAIIASVAVLQLGMIQDLGLTVAAIALLVSLRHQRSALVLFPHREHLHHALR